MAQPHAGWQRLCHPGHEQGPGVASAPGVFPVPGARPAGAELWRGHCCGLGQPGEPRGAGSGAIRMWHSISLAQPAGSREGRGAATVPGGSQSPWGLPRSLGAATVPLHGAPGCDTTGRWLLTLPGDLNPPEGSGRDRPCAGRGMNPSPPPHTPSPRLLPAAPGGPGLCWGRGGGPAAHAGGRVAGAAGRPQPSFLRCWVPLCC